MRNRLAYSGSCQGLIFRTVFGDMSPKRPRIFRAVVFEELSKFFEELFFRGVSVVLKKYEIYCAVQCSVRKLLGL